MEKQPNPGKRTQERVRTGIEGLDEILHGGLIPGRGYLLRGGPGMGKTLMGTEFLQTGVEEGKTSLLVTLEEPAQDLAESAASAGLDLTGIDVLDLSTGSEAFGPGETYDVFAPEEVESEELIEQIVDGLEEHQPDRVFLDPITMLSYLAPDPFQFRKQVLGLSSRIRELGATLVVTAQIGEGDAERDLQFLTDGTIELSDAGAFRRLEVPKFRGSSTVSGPHAFRITDDGIRVFPNLLPGERVTSFTGEQIPSGIDRVDEMLNGGIERSTATVISGPTGAGKTTLGSQFVKEAAKRDEASAIYLFEESKDTFLARTDAIGSTIRPMLEEETMIVRELEPLAKSPEELAQLMRRDVRDNDVEVVMIDGISGYRLATGGDVEALLPELHSVVRYLKNQGVTVILTDETRELSGNFEATGGHVSYLADNIVFLRHIELDGELRKTFGVLKKRASDFERHLREFEITSEGIVVSEPIEGLRGVLSGIPESVGR